MKASELARGRWPSILPILGIGSHYLVNSHGPCPICSLNGGVDNKKPFRFDDNAGRGTWICTHHGAGDGWDLLRLFHNWDYKTAAQEVEKVVEGCPSSDTREPEKDVEKIKRGIHRIWTGAKTPQVVDDYLKSRGLSVTSKALRGHPAVNYLDKTTGELTKFKAVIALVTSQDGKTTTLHRTFLFQNGEREKRLYRVIPDTWLGGSIRLFPHNGHIALTEGIETALAIYELTGCPAWAAITANGMEAWQPPEDIKRVSIFGDNDASFVGQRAAYVLAHKLAVLGIDVDVRNPREQGDWLDYLWTRKREEKRCGKD